LRIVDLLNLLGELSRHLMTALGEFLLFAFCFLLPENNVFAPTLKHNPARTEIACSPFLYAGVCRVARPGGIAAS